MKPHPLTLAGLLAFCLAVPATFAAEPPAASPIGHKDFVPTPQRPIDFRAGGNDWYPGAGQAIGAKIIASAVFQKDAEAARQEITNVFAKK